MINGGFFDPCIIGPVRNGRVTGPRIQHFVNGRLDPVRLLIQHEIFARRGPIVVVWNDPYVFRPTGLGAKRGGGVMLNGQVYGANVLFGPVRQYRRLPRSGVRLDCFLQVNLPMVDDSNASIPNVLPALRLSNRGQRRMHAGEFNQYGASNLAVINCHLAPSMYVEGDFPIYKGFGLWDRLHLRVKLLGAKRCNANAIKGRRYMRMFIIPIR